MLKYVGSSDNFFSGDKNVFQSINKSPFIVGRASTADFVLTNINVSRKHCSFTFVDNVWELQCLGLAGLTVDGQYLEQGEKTRITNKALISLVENVHILFASRQKQDHHQSIEIVEVVDVKVGSAADFCGGAEASGSVKNSEDCAGASKPNDSMVEHVNSLQQHFADAKRQITKLTEELAERVEDLAKVRAELSKTATDQEKGCDSNACADLVEAGSVVVSAVEEASKEREAELIEAHQKNNQLQLQLLTHQADALDKEEENVKLRDEIKNLTKQLSFMEIKLVETEEQNVRLQGLVTKANADLVEAQSLTFSFKEEAFEATNKQKETETELIEVKQKNSRLQQESSEHQANVLIKEEENVKLKDEIKNLTKQFSFMEIKLNETEEQNVRLQGLVTKAQADLVEAQSLAASLKEEASEAKNKQKEVEAELIEVKSKNGRLQQESSDHQANVLIKEEENVKLRDEVKKLTTQLRSNTAELIDVRQRNAHLQHELSTHQADARVKEDKIKKLKADFEAGKDAAKSEQMEKFEEFIEIDLQCAICFELVIASTVLNCGHTFCNKCVRDWQARSPNCPTCRVLITNMQTCKMLDSFIARAAHQLSKEFCERRREATGNRGTDSQGHPLNKKRRVSNVRGRQLHFELPGPAPLPGVGGVIDLT